MSKTNDMDINKKQTTNVPKIKMYNHLTELIGCATLMIVFIHDYLFWIGHINFALN